MHARTTLPHDAGRLPARRAGTGLLLDEAPPTALRPQPLRRGGRTPLQRDARTGGGVVSGSAAPARAEELERRFAAGDPHVVREAYDVHGSLVYNLCRRVVGDAHAADVSQEVWVAAWRSRERYRPEAGSLAGWLVGIARFKAIDHLRRSARRPGVDDLGDAAERLERTATGDAGGAPEQVAERLLVAEALRLLDERPRAVLELAFYSELTHQEIAERTGVPLGTVKSDIRRGLERLRRHLEGFDAADRP